MIVNFVFKDSNMTAIQKNMNILVFCLLIAVILLPDTGWAQSSSQLQTQINQLEKQMQTMSRAVYRGETPKTSANYQTQTSGTEASLANVEIRISNIEKELRLTTGQLERYEHENRNLNEKIKRLEHQLADLRNIPNNNRQIASKALNTKKIAPTTTTPININKPAEMQQLGVLRTPINTTNKNDIELSHSMPVTTKSTAGVTSSNVIEPEKAYEEAYTYIRNGKYNDAALKFKAFLDKYPNNKLSSNAQYWLAETYYVRGKYTEAAKLFAKGYEQYPKSSKTADNLLKLGLSLSKKGNKKDACLTLSQLEKEFPKKTGIIMQRSLQEKKRLECSKI